MKLSYITSIDTCMCRIDKHLQCTNKIYSLHSDHNKSHTLSFPHMTLCLPRSPCGLSKGVTSQSNKTTVPSHLVVQWTANIDTSTTTAYSYKCRMSQRSQKFQGIPLKSHILLKIKTPLKL